MNIRFTTRGIPELQAKLKDIAYSSQRFFTEQVSKYLVGDSTHGLKQDASYKYVNRYAGYPELGYVSRGGKWVPGWASEKQHRYVMAMIKEGKIVPGRRANSPTNLSRGWTYKPGAANKYVIDNPLPYAAYVVGDRQTRMHKLIGWRHYMKNVQDNIKGAIRHAQAELKKFIASKRK